MMFLVTGAGGFLGSHVVEHLLAKGETVRALVRDAGKAEALRRRGVEVIAGDVRSPEDLRSIVRGADVILHCAAAVGPHFSKREIYETNLTGVRNLLDAVEQAGRGRVVLMSSVNVLGTCNLDSATEELPYRRSNDPAADVKIEAEQLAQSSLVKGVDVVIVRPGFIYGPGDPHNLPKLAQAIERGKFRFIGSRDNIVPIVHVSDAARAVILAGTVPAARGKIYNVTDGSRTTIGELADTIAQTLGCPPPQKRLPFFVPQLACVLFDVIGLVKKVKAPINRASLRFLGTSRFVDIGRARQELGYAPQVSVKDGIPASLRELRPSSSESAHVSSHPS
jgi:nucleoside-diphosphate-sugar epimerase